MNKQIITGVFCVMLCGSAAVFGAVPFLFSATSTPVASGQVQGAVVSESSEPSPIAAFRSLIPAQDFVPFDTESVTASSLVVLDTKTGNVLLEKNADEPHTLASLTKLVTAALLFDRTFSATSASVSASTIPNAYADYGIPLTPEEGVSRLRLVQPETFSAHQLLEAMLIASANDAAFALVDSQGFTSEQFLKAMQEYLTEHGAVHTSIYDPSGLHYRNTSTAREFAQLVREAFSYADIRTITQQSSTTIQSTTSGKAYPITSTNGLLEITDGILGGKTGYLDASGYTLALLTQHSSGRELVLVLFGATSKGTRIDDALQVIDWLQQAYVL